MSSFVTFEYQGTLLSPIGVLFLLLTRRSRQRYQRLECAVAPVSRGTVYHSRVKCGIPRQIQV